MKLYALVLAACATTAREPPSAHTLPPPPTSIHGTIRSPDGDLVPGVTLLVSPIGHRPIAELTSEDGTFAIPSLPAGRYEVTIHYADLVMRCVVDVRGATIVDQTLDDHHPPRCR